MKAPDQTGGGNGRVKGFPVRSGKMHLKPTVSKDTGWDIIWRQKGEILSHWHKVSNSETVEEIELVLANWHHGS